jgi:Ca-activated chloride channel family protein
MTSKILISLNLALIFFAPKLCAQLAPADDFFNSGAQFYISNNVPAALERVENGLKTYPDDVKLKKLEQLLKQQQQQQNQQQQNQQNQSQQQKQDQQKNQQSQNQQSSPQNSQDQKKADEQKQNQAGQKKDEPQKPPEQQKSSAEKKDGEKPDQPEAEGQPVKAGQITPDEAKRLLDAQKEDEQLLKLKPPEKPRNTLRPVKDW